MEGERGGKKGIFKKHLCWEARSAGMVSSALLLAAALGEGHRTSALPRALRAGDSQIAILWGRI